MIGKQATVAIPATGVRINLRMFSLVNITCLDLMILLLLF